MIHGLLGRAAGGVLTLLVVVTLAFALLHLAPGEPAALADDPSLRPADRERLREAFGLDRPPLEQYLAYLGHVARGDLGISLSRQRPVAAVLASALGPTLLLAGTALLLAFLLGIFVGTRAASRPGGLADRAVQWLLPALDAVPPFWLGLCGILLFAWKLDWLPASHMSSAIGTATPGLLDVARHLVLPALVLALPGSAPVARHHWAAMRRELRSRHVLAARAFGVPEWRVVWLRAGRAALQPLVALLGLALPALVGGAVVVEVVFSWPGLGRVHQQALLARDLPLVLGGLILIATVVVAGGLLADLLSRLVDPRLRSSVRREGRG